MAQSIDELSIQIVSSTVKAKNSIDKLVTSLNGLKGALSELNAQNLNSVSESLQKVGNSLSSIKGNNAEKSIKRIGDTCKSVKKDIDSFKTSTSDGFQYPAVIKNVGTSLSIVSKDVSNSIGSIQNSINNFDIVPFTTALSRAAEIMGYFNNARERLLTGPQSTPRYLIGEDNIFDTTYTEINDEGIRNERNAAENLRETYLAVADAKSTALANTDEGKVNRSVSIIKELSTILSTTGSTISKIGSKSLKFIAGLSGIPIATKAINSASKELRVKFDAVFKSIQRIYKMSRLMITRKILQAVIKNAITGFTNLIQYSGKFDASVSLLWNSMRQLGNAVASAVAPLINALAPAINYIIQLCIRAVNAINQLISALLGNGTWTKAKTLTDDYAKSLDKSNKSAKALKKTVLGFDELNQLQDNSNSGGGLTDPANMFEEAGVDSKWKDFANWLKSMWDKADFTDLGALIGQKLKDALDSIPWDEIKEKARKLGSSLATLINGFIETEGLGYSIGKTLAEAINTGFEFLNEFVHKLHWESVGKFVADTLNGFFESIDWELIKDTVITGVKGLSASINSFIENFHWDNISTTISNAVNTLAEAVLTFFTDTKFKELGEKLGEQLRKTVEDIDWEKVGEAIGSILQSAFDFAKGLLTPETLSAFKDAISDLLKGFFEKVDKEDLAKVIAVVVGGALTLSVGKLLAGEAVKRVGAKIIASVFGDAAVKVAGQKAVGDAVEGALLGTATAPTVTSAVATLGGALGLALAGAIGAKLGEGLAHIIGDISGDEFYKNFSLFGDDDYGFFKNIKDLWDMTFNKDTTTRMGELLQEIKNGSIETYQEIDKLSEKYGLNEGQLKVLDYQMEQTTGKTREFADGFKNSSDKLKTTSDEIQITVDGLSSITKKSFDNMNESAKTISFSPIVTKAQELESKLSASTENCKNKVTVMKETVSADVANMSDQIELSWNTISKSTDEGATQVTNTTETLKKAFDKDKWTLQGVKDGIQATFENAIEIAKSIWNSLADWINEKAKIHIDPITIMGKTIFDGADFTLFELPKFATGGFPEDGLFMANHGEMVGKFSNGKTAVANNEQITDGIAQAVYSAIISANSNSGSGQYINNTIQIDGETIARAVTKGQQSINRRYSPTMA